ncbi:MAG: hypothetical protein PVH23_05185, partial [candidate division WOR-3 bacterium]
MKYLLSSVPRYSITSEGALHAVKSINCSMNACSFVHAPKPKPAPVSFKKHTGKTLFSQYMKK